MNMEIAVLRAMMKRAKVWSIVAEDVKLDPEDTNVLRLNRPVDFNSSPRSASAVSCEFRLGRRVLRSEKV